MIFGTKRKWTMLFTINTPGPGFTRDFPTVEDALNWAEEGLPCPEGARRERSQSGDRYYTRVMVGDHALTGAVVCPA